jgi:hypothetical protein
VDTLKTKNKRNNMPQNDFSIHRHLHPDHLR